MGWSCCLKPDLCTEWETMTVPQFLPEPQAVLGEGKTQGHAPPGHRARQRRDRLLGASKPLAHWVRLSPPFPPTHLVPPAEFCPRRCLRCSGRCRSSFQHPLGWRGESAAVRWVGPGHWLLDWVEGNRKPVAGTTGPPRRAGGQLGLFCLIGQQVTRCGHRVLRGHSERKSWTQSPARLSPPRPNPTTECSGRLGLWVVKGGRR